MLGKLIYSDFHRAEETILAFPLACTERGSTNGEANFANALVVHTLQQ
jgi:hypothetical protein